MVLILKFLNCFHDSIVSAFSDATLNTKRALLLDEPPSPDGLIDICPEAKRKKLMGIPVANTTIAASDSPGSASSGGPRTRRDSVNRYLLTCL